MSIFLCCPHVRCLRSFLIRSVYSSIVFIIFTCWLRWKTNWAQKSAWRWHLRCLRLYKQSVLIHQIFIIQVPDLYVGSPELSNMWQHLMLPRKRTAAVSCSSEVTALTALSLEPKELLARKEAPLQDVTLIMSQRLALEAELKAAAEWSPFPVRFLVTRARFSVMLKSSGPLLRWSTGWIRSIAIRVWQLKPRENSWLGISSLRAISKMWWILRRQSTVVWVKSNRAPAMLDKVGAESGLAVSRPSSIRIPNHNNRRKYLFTIPKASGTHTTVGLVSQRSKTPAPCLFFRELA